VLGRLCYISRIIFVITVLFSLVGCVETLSAVGTGAMVSIEYIMTGEVTETINYEFSRIKKALLVVLCEMKIDVDRSKPTEQGEQIIAKAEDLDIEIELREITPTLTRVAVKAQDGIIKRDKATAREILSETNRVAGSLADPSYLVYLQNTGSKHTAP